MFGLMFSSMFGPSEDGFANNLIIPEDTEITEPSKELNTESGSKKDSFQQALLNVLISSENNDSTITANVTSLATLEQNNLEILRRYLASSPSWRVFTEHGQIFATRRWIVGTKWQYTLHGYYTKHDIAPWPKAGLPNFQSRFTIGLSGEPWWRGNEDTTRLKAGKTAKVRLSENNQIYESHCIITAEALLIEVFEQSETMERQLTKAAMVHVNKELDRLVAEPTLENIYNILPDDSIRQGNTSLELRESFQPGLYDSEIWTNPGEPGMIYLKVFEITQETPLSVDRLKKSSNEWIGWSDNPTELFFSNTHFTIYEGDWGKPYAARFEVWFTPDTGRADRKLFEKIFNGNLTGSE